MIIRKSTLWEIITTDYALIGIKILIKGEKTVLTNLNGVSSEIWRTQGNLIMLV